MILFAVGALLLLLEMFLPTFGIVGVAGIVCIISGIVLRAYDLGAGVTPFVVALVICVVAFGAAYWVLKRRGVWRRFVLNEQLTTDKGYVSSAPKDALLGKTGIALTPLRPAGVADIGHERIDVVTSGEFIEPGTRIEVFKIEGARIVVRVKSNDIR